MFDSYLEDVFGKRYVLKQPFDIASQGSLTSLKFTSEGQAFQFICRLRTSQNYWQRTISNIPSISAKQTNTKSNYSERQISQLLYRKQLFVYELANFSKDSADSYKRSVETGNGDKYTFSHASTLLVAAPLDLVDLNTKADAEKLLQDISPNDEQLEQIASELNIQKSASASSAVTKGLIVEAIVANEVVVSVQKKLASPPMPTEESTAAAVDKPVSLSPEATVTITAAAAVDPMSNINQKSQADTLKNASEDGKPFCEECEKAKAEQAS